MNMFEMFGLDEPNLADAEKASGKKAKNAPKALNKPAARKLPVTIYTGYYEGIPLTKEMFQGKEELLNDEISSYLEDLHPEMDKNMIHMHWDKDKAYVTFRSENYIAKGSIKISPESKLYLAGKELDLSSFLEGDKTEADIKDLSVEAAKQSPVFLTEGIGFYRHGNTIVADYRETLPKKLGFPIRILVLGRGKLQLSEAEYKEKAKGAAPDEAGVSKIIAEHFPEFNGRVGLAYNKKVNTIIVTMRASSTAPSGSAPKKKVYPVTEGTSISLGYAKIPVSPEMFGGKEEVSESDLIKFLQEDHPEYSRERTFFWHDPKLNLIIAALKSSSKGAAVSIQEATGIFEENSGYSVFEAIDSNEVRYRGENLPYMGILASTGRERLGFIRYRLPKIPGILWTHARRFFKFISEVYDTESMLQLFWDIERQGYFWYYPKQYAYFSHLSCERNASMEHSGKSYLVAEVHSHGRIDCSFSQTDDADELAPRLYGVFYGYGKPEARESFDLRAGTGGHFIDVDPCAITDGSPYEM